jgi:hypothetical protein
MAMSAMMSSIIVKTDFYPEWLRYNLGCGFRIRMGN